MGDRPIYPKQLDPKAWENAKGTLAKAVIKADVKGSLEKASRTYWEGVPWQLLESWENETPETLKTAVDKVEAFRREMAAVEANALQGMREIDKVPANKLTMKASRTYLDEMSKAAKKFSDAAQALAAGVQAASLKARTAEANAEANFEGWMALHAGKALGLVKECEMRCKAAGGSVATLQKGSQERLKLSADQLKIVDDLIAALKKIYTDAEAKFEASGKMEQLRCMQKYTAFKAAQAGQLATMDKARDELSKK